MLSRALPGGRGVAGLVAVVAAIGLAAAALGAPTGPSAPPPRYYLALGDSLAAGVQPDAHGRYHGTTQGYADDLTVALRRHAPHVELVNLGRGGENAFSLIHGKPKAGTPQLARAEAFLGAHRGDPTLLTIDIGANDVEDCHANLEFDRGCAAAGVRSIRKNVPLIVQRLRAAAGPGLRIIGVNYYNGYLGQYIYGVHGRAVARRSIAVEQQLNAELGRAYARMGVRVADVERAFSTDAFERPTTTRAGGRVPVAVERVCRWTYVCTPVRDDHANPAGYRVIAKAILPLAAR